CWRDCGFTASSGLQCRVVRGDRDRHRWFVLGLPVSLVRRLLPQRQYFGGQSRFLQSEPVLRRRIRGAKADPEPSRSPAVAAQPDVSLISAFGGKADTANGVRDID